MKNCNEIMRGRTGGAIEKESLLYFKASVLRTETFLPTIRRREARIGTHRRMESVSGKHGSNRQCNTLEPDRANGDGTSILFE